MARSKKRHSRNRIRFWPALLGLLVAAGILTGAYYGITRLLAGVVPAGNSGIPGLVAVESSLSPAVHKTVDTGVAYFGDLPSRYAFRVTVGSLPVEDLPGLIQLTDSRGQQLRVATVKRQSGFDIKPADHDFVAGETYRITLTTPLQFVAENLQPYHTVYFRIAGDYAEQVVYKTHVVQLNVSDVISADGPDLIVRGGSCKAGNILILPPGVSGSSTARAVIAESVTEAVDGLHVFTREPALAEVFRDLDLSGRYALQISQANLSVAQRSGLTVINQSGGSTIRIQATVSPFGDDGPRMVMVYEDQPELMIDLREDGTVAFALYSNGKTSLDYELASDAAGGLSPDVNRQEIISRLQTALASEPDLLAENATLLQAKLTPVDSALSLELNILINLEAAFKGNLSGQLNENLGSTAGVMLFADQALAYGSVDEADSLTGSIRLLGSSRLSGAVSLQARMSLLQFAEVTLDSRTGWQSESAGFLGTANEIWGSLPGQEPSALPLGWYTAAGSSLMTGSLVSRNGTAEQRFDGLTCYAVDSKPLGPWGVQQIPLTLSAPGTVEFDETMDTVALPGIDLQSLDLIGNQITGTAADPADILFLFNRSQLFLDSNGMLQLPAGLALGEYTADLSLVGLPDVKGNLTLRKVKPQLSADLRLIAELLTMQKADAIARLGTSFTRVAAGADGWLDGFEYESRGLTLCFYPAGMQPDPDNGITEDDLDRTVMIYCDSKIDINEARVGMTTRQIKAILGEPTAFYPASEYFMLDVSLYNIQGLMISFAGAGDSEATSYAFISLVK